MTPALFKYFISSLLLAFICHYQSDIKNIPQDSIVSQSGKNEMLLTGSRRNVPNLIGLKLSDAIQKLKNAKLNVGIIVADDSVKTTFLSELRVFLQNPKHVSETGAMVMLKRGDQVDIWVTEDQQKIDSAIRSKDE